ncbi:glycoside hydrolase family 15 protein [Zavarzinia sp. CC-PAN008]|uniref:glycoside hydrolase family 15 protein n=1 Tax=Zavarzinia sp. CC-PAN008 TaxID=3243332 RepID=UPI003F745999
MDGSTAALPHADRIANRGRPGLIEDYAVIGNCETLALVGRSGSIDWLGLPRFDSDACFAALLGDPSHGRWLITPEDGDVRVSRRYRPRTLVLETTFETAEGAVLVTDFMARRDGASDLVRLVRGLRGRVSMVLDLVVRFGNGAIVPWVTRQQDGRLQLTAGPDRLLLASDIALTGRDQRTAGHFVVEAGQEVGFALSWGLSHRPPPEALDIAHALAEVQDFWTGWAQTCASAGPWSEAVVRSLITLKALTHWETGGIVAAGTTSLPERIGGPRNWDYRLCWLRDSTFTLLALIEAGYLGEAQAWRQWLLRAIAGDPGDLQIMYGVAGERRLPEYEVPWLTGYEGSRPVRIGNAAAGQLQLDVYGQVLDTLYTARHAGLAADGASWALERTLVTSLESLWRQPDEGIWEVRGGKRHFTHSKAMAWVAFDRAIRSCQEFGLDGPVERWSRVRDEIHAEVCRRGFDADRNTFVQSYGASALDASLLLLPIVGFLPPDDPRIRGTVAAIERDLVRDGLVLRYDTGSSVDGLPPGEGAFLACSFWLADNYVLQGRRDEAKALFERLLGLANDVGLLAEEYDPADRRQLGNFPQAFSHLALVDTARRLTEAGPAHERTLGGAAAHQVRGAQRGDAGHPSPQDRPEVNRPDAAGDKRKARPRKTGPG